MAFQVGSIFAKIGLDVQAFRQGANETLKIADRLAKDVQAKLIRAGVSLGKAFGIDEAVLLKQAKSVKEIIKGIVESGNKEFKKFGGPQFIGRQLGRIGISKADVRRSLEGLGQEFQRFRQVAAREFSTIGNAIVPPGTRFRSALDRLGGDVKRFAADARADFARGFNVSPAAIGGKISAGLKSIGGVVQRSVVNPVSNAFRVAGEAASKNILEPFKRGFAGLPALARRNVLLPFEQTFAQVQAAARKRLIVPPELEGQLSRLGDSALTKFARPFVNGIQLAAAGAGRLARALAPLGRISLAGTQVAIKGIQVALVGLGRAAALGVGQAVRALRALQPVAKFVTGALGLAAKVVVTEFSVLRTVLSSLLSPFRAIRNAIFSIQGVLAGFAVFKLINTAKEVEKTSAAFASLSREVGSTADAFLGQLRNATKGTISDLKLMQLATEAVFLGVAKDAGSFAELAGKVGELGETLGNTSAESIEAFVQGVATMQTRTLRQVGIIVDAETAFAEYRLSINAVNRELTDAEQRTAFAEAATRKLNEQIGKISGNLTPVQQGFERLEASFSNTFAAIASAIVGGRVPEAIASFLDRNLDRIAAFAALVGRILAAVVDAFEELIRSLESGELTAGKILGGLTQFVADSFGAALAAAIRVSLNVLRVSLTNFLPGIIQLVLRLLLAAIPAVVSELARAIFLSLRTAIPKLADFLGIGDSAREIDQQVRGIREALTIGEDPGRLRKLAEEEAKVIQKFRENAVRLHPAFNDAQIDELVNRFRERLDRSGVFKPPKLQEVDILSQKSIDNFKSGVFDLASSTVGILSETFKPVGENVVRNFGKPLEVLFTGVDNALKAFGFDLDDVLARFRGVRVDPAVQGFSDLLSATVQLRRELIETGSIFFNNPIFKTASAFVVNKTKGALEALSGALSAARANFKAGGLDVVDFDKRLRKIDAETEQIRIEASTTGFDQASARLEKLVSEIREARQIAIDAGNEGAFNRAQERLATASKAIAEFETTEINRKLREFNDQLASIGASDAQRSVLELQRRFEHLDESLAESPERLEKLRELLNELTKKPFEIEVKLKIQEFESQLDQLQLQIENLGLSQGEILARDIEIQIRKLELAGGKAEDIAKLQLQRQQALDIQGQIDFTDLTKGVSDSIFGGILDGFERGESAAKIWSDIVSDIFRKSMQKVIDGLTTTISKGLGDIFGRLGLGLGAADLATGLLGIGSSILVGLRNRRDQTVSDFSQQVNSSEAIRGVVAGPTNVAIAKVGDSLKFALQTTEILLERIATAVERGGGGGPSSNGTPFSTRLTSSTPT